MKARRRFHSVVVFVGAIILSQLAGVLGMLFTMPLSTWYAGLVKPFFTPPSWAFGPVWITLYTLMGIALWVVWRARPRDHVPYVLFGVQLVLNMLWSILFFGLQQPGIAFGEILVLWIAVAFTLQSFWNTHQAAGWLLVPYLTWVTIATALNLSIWMLNV
ncbi:MAG: tryptophan-rich sensory protein [Nanoarchaeota archaeon]|nr:tryptophan-rich sensory protein [Nanoarchaeota archaeon]